MVNQYPGISMLENYFSYNVEWLFHQQIFYYSGMFITYNIG